MSETILNTLKFTTAQCLEFEGSKNEKLQYFLVNSLRTISDLEAQLKESRIDTIAARNEVNFLKSEMSANKRKPGTKTFPSSSSSTAHQSQESGMYGGDDDEEIIIEQRPKQRRKSAPLQSPPLPSCAALASQMMPFSTRVERAIDSVATSLINPHENTPPKTFLFKFVCRIFDGGDLYYGYIVAYEKFHFQVVYNDGDTQRLSVKEVRLSLVEDVLVPTQIANDCKKHHQKGSYLTRTPLPTIS